MGQWAQDGTQEVPPEYEEKLLSCEGARAWAQAAQGGCGVPSLETFKPHLDVVLCPLLWMCLLKQGGWTR